jgi:hypothetical protein
MPNITICYERTKLYEEVWAEAVTKVAKRYGVSDVALRKICKRLSVPLPPLGYWAKLAAGKKLGIPPLPEYAGNPVIVSSRFVQDEPVEADPDHLVARRLSEEQAENRIIVSARLNSPHPLIVATQQAFNQSKHKDHRNLPLAGRGTLDIAVSEENLPRALRILDALIKAMELRGMRVRIETEGKHHTLIDVQGEAIPVRMVENTVRTERIPTARERQEQEKYGWSYLPNRYLYNPTGQLKLGVIGWSYGDMRKAVSDSTRQKIEQRLNEFLVNLEVEAVQRRRDTERREQQHRIWEEQERIRREQEERRKQEIERLKILESNAHDWRRAEDVRRYVAAVEAKAIREGESMDSESKLGRWITWARNKADWIDPLVAAACPILDDGDGDGDDEEEEC